MNRALQDLAATNIPDLSRAAVAEIIRGLQESLKAAGAEYFEDVNKLYWKFAASNTVVRREDPWKVLEAVGGAPYTIAFRAGEPYANAAEFGPAGEGMKNAILEGHAGDAVVTVVGFDRGNVSVKPVPQEKLLAKRGLDRRYVRAVSGTVPQESIRFVVVRVPKKIFPENELTEADEERAFVLRGFGFPKKAREKRAAA